MVGLPSSLHPSRRVLSGTQNEHDSVPAAPHKPIGLLRAILAWHANPAERPAALEEAREAAERRAASAATARAAACPAPPSAR